MDNRMPALFVGHGSPMNAIEDTRFSEGWEKIGAGLPRPKAILSVSAHWYTHGLWTSDVRRPRQVFDMYGFPKALYDVAYPAQGSPDLAHRLEELLGYRLGIDDSWGIDHGTWSVLHRMFPKADIPVVQLSVDGDVSPAEHLELGRRLAGLRDEGIMILGSGCIVHNLGMVDWDSDGGYGWAESFDGWVRDRIEAHDHDSLVDFGSRGEEALLAVPTPDHYLPLLTVLGTTSPNDAVSIFSQGCTLGSMSMTSYLFG